jgi:LemA protein
MQYSNTLLFIIVIVVGYAIATFNYLVRLRNHIGDAWSNIDTELKRRYELIPSLVAAIKGYTAHEKEVLGRVVELRNICMADNGSVGHQESSQKLLVGAMQDLMLVAEAYPDLKADNNFMQLQVELVNTEDRIQAARRFYNGNVRDYENRRESFPGNIVANMFGFEARSFFNVDPAVRAAPSVAGLH